MKNKIAILLGFGLIVTPVSFLDGINFSGTEKKVQQRAKQIQKKVQEQASTVQKQLKNIMGREEAKPVEEEKPTKKVASPESIKTQLQSLGENFEKEKISEADLEKYYELLSKCEQLNCFTQEELGKYRYLGARTSLDSFKNEYYNKMLKGVKEKGPVAVRKALSDLIDETGADYIQEVLQTYGVMYNQLVNNKQYYKGTDHAVKADEVRGIYREMLDLALLDILSDFNEKGEYKGDQPFADQQKKLFSFLSKIFQQIDPSYAGMLEQKWKSAVEKAGAPIKSTILSPMEKNKPNKN